MHNIPYTSTDRCWPCKLRGAGGAQSFNRGNTLCWFVTHGFRAAPRKFLIHMLPNQMQVEKQEQQKSLHSFRQLQAWGRHVCITQVRLTQIQKGRPPKGRRLKPGERHCLRLTVTTGHLALHDYMVPKGQERWFPTHSPPPSFWILRPFRLQWKYEAR